MLRQRIGRLGLILKYLILFDSLKIFCCTFLVAALKFSEFSTLQPSDWSVLTKAVSLLVSLLESLIPVIIKGGMMDNLQHRKTKIFGGSTWDNESIAQKQRKSTAQTFTKWKHNMTSGTMLVFHWCNFISSYI